MYCNLCQYFLDLTPKFYLEILQNREDHTKYSKFISKSSFWLKLLLKNTLYMFLKCFGDVTEPEPRYKIFGQKTVYHNGSNILISSGVESFSLLNSFTKNFLTKFIYQTFSLPDSFAKFSVRNSSRNAQLKRNPAG